jgi:hypothetical protein
MRRPVRRGARTGRVRARPIAAAIALAGALSLAVYSALGERGMPVLIIAGCVAIVLLGSGMALGNTLLMTGGIAVLGSQFVLSLYVRGEAATFTAAGYGVALLLVAEIGYWSMELGAGYRGASGVLRRRVVATVSLVGASLVVGILAAAISQAAIPGSVLLTALGVGCVLAVLAIVAMLLWPGDLRAQERHD